MKKLLSILGAVALISTGATSAVSCSANTSNNDKKVLQDCTFTAVTFVQKTFKDTKKNSISQFKKINNINDGIDCTFFDKNKKVIDDTIFNKLNNQDEIFVQFSNESEKTSLFLTKVWKTNPIAKASLDNVHLNNYAMSLKSAKLELINKLKIQNVDSQKLNLNDFNKIIIKNKNQEITDDSSWFNLPSKTELTVKFIAKNGDEFIEGETGDLAFTTINRVNITNWTPNENVPEVLNLNDLKDWDTLLKKLDFIFQSGRTDGLENLSAINDAEYNITIEDHQEHIITDQDLDILKKLDSAFIRISAIANPSVPYPIYIEGTFKHEFKIIK